MIVPKLIEDNLKRIRTELRQISEAEIIYEADYIERLTKYLDTLLNTNGIQQSTTIPPNGNDSLQRSHLLTLQREFTQFMKDINVSVQDSGLSLNIVLSKLSKELDRIDAVIENLIQNTDDIEEKVLEKVVDRSIYSSEIKVIDFKKNYGTADVYITDDNIITLPVTSLVRSNLTRLALQVKHPTDATSALAPTVSNTLNKSNERLPEGFWLGSLVGDDLSIIKRTNIADLYNFLDRMNDEFLIQLFDNNTTEKAELEIIGNLPIGVNQVEIISDAEMTTLIDNDTVIPLKNKLYTKLVSGEKRIIFEKSTKDTVNYSQLVLTPKFSKSKNDVKYRNAIESSIFLASSIDGDLTPIKSSLNLLTKANRRALDIPIIGSFLEKIWGTKASRKYDISTRNSTMDLFQFKIKKIDFRSVTYRLGGSWTSEVISTDKAIRAVELTDIVSIPDDETQYIMYKVSFDGTTWYDLRSQSSAPTKFNKSKPIRIELNTNSVREDYKVLSDMSPQYGIYLKVILATNDVHKTPVIEEVKLRVKVVEE